MFQPIHCSSRCQLVLTKPMLFLSASRKVIKAARNAEQVHHCQHYLIVIISTAKGQLP